MRSMLSVQTLTKKFGKSIAVDNISLEIPPGKVYALIGPNGSGKTTLSNCVVGLLRPDAGKVLVGGVDVQKDPLLAKKLFTYVSDNPAIYPYLTGYEFLRLTANVYGMKKDETDKRIDQLKDLFPIGDILPGLTENYSRGNMEKTAILSAILPKPLLLVIDEPIVGLDPASTEILGSILIDLTKKGSAVLMSTHTLSFAKKYAHKVGVIYKGKLVKEIDIGSKTDLEKIYEQSTINA